MICLKAVSYTHLDVYKRQGYMYYDCVCGKRFTYTGNRIVFGFCCMGSIVSVSYTHLDVYKRQSNCLAKTQVYAKPKGEVYGLTPARCWKVTRSA